MEALSTALQPHKESVGLAASAVTILQFFSGALICRDIYARKRTRGISSMPFIGGIVIGILVLKFALILQDKNMFNVNVAAIVLNSIYILIYSYYSKDWYEEVGNPAFKGTLLIGGLFTYVSYEDPELIEFRYGLIVTILMLLLMGAPLVELKQIIECEDASSIPLPLTFMGFIVSLLWLLYGVILQNTFMIVQNILGTLLCSVQLALIIMYPGPSRHRKRD